jgi:hypothetical protein
MVRETVDRDVIGYASFRSNSKPDYSRAKTGRQSAQARFRRRVRGRTRSIGDVPGILRRLTSRVDRVYWWLVPRFS